jgi:thermostable 8-oxoguanine DNA glycosylase
MIDPYDLNQPWTKARLEEWILFGICVANKPARATAEKLDRFLDAGVACRWEGECAESPFARVRFFIRYKQLGWRLRRFRMGQYKRINRAFREVVKLDLDTVSVESLEQVHGIGPKTARMIMLYYKPELQVVPLDTHVLKWLKAQGYNAPKSTPTGKRYRELEQAFLAEANKMGLSAKELDTRVWQLYAIG